MILKLLRGLNNVSRSSKPPARRGRNHRRALRIETLENRELLAVSPGSLQIGAGLDGLTYWETTFMFKDVMKMAADSWNVVYPTHATSPFNVTGVPQPTMDSNGYPIGLGNLPSQGYALDTIVFTHNGGVYPTGTYTLTFDGGGTIEIVNGLQQPQVFSQSGGSGSPSNVYINATSPDGILVVITSSNASDYVRNIRLVMPGFQNSYLTEPFNPAFLSELEPMQQVRVGGLMGLNTTTQNVGLTWANETPVTYRTQTKSTGVSVEYLVDLANVLDENLWVNMPVGADSAFVTNFSQYVAQNLDSNLKVYVEYGNEVWNDGYYDEWNYVNTYAVANNLTIDQATAVLATNMWNVWLQSFGSQDSRVLRVVANQFVAPTRFSTEIAELVKISSPTDPDHGFDVVSGAPYFGPNTNAYNAQTTVQQIESDSMASLTKLQTQLQSFMSMVTGWTTQLNQTIPAVMYETGLSLYTSSKSVPWWNAFVAAQTDSGMYPVLMAYFQDLQAAGVAGFNYSDLVYPTSTYGEWGTMNYIGEPPSLTPKYSALVDFIDSRGPSLSLADTATTLTAGTANSFTVTAYDASGNVNTNYTGTVQFSSSDPDASLPASYTFTAADAGEHTFSAAFDTAGLQSISVTDSTDGFYSLDWGVSVQPAAANSLVVLEFPSPVAAGYFGNMVLFAIDPYGNIATGYRGTVKLSSSDPRAYFPGGNITFTNGTNPSTSGDLGYATFIAELKTAGVQSVTATDSSTSSITGAESNITITPAAVYSLKVAGFPNPTTAGVANNFTVTAYDYFGNVVTGYLGTVKFTSSDPNASLPANYTFVAADAGTHTFSATLKTAANQSITATDTTTATVTGTEASIAVHPAAAKTFTVSGFPGTATAGVAYNLTVTARDAYGNVASGYTGTIKFSSSDPKASLPANYTFPTGAWGTHTFSATLKTAGVQSITATDTSTSSITGTESNITVTPATAYVLSIVGLPSSVKAGTAYSFTITAYDAFGNVATGYLGTVQFSSSDSAALLPAGYTFTAADAGSHHFTVTFRTKGTQTLTVKDSIHQLSTTQSGIVVS